MVQPSVVTSPAVIAVLSVCGLSIGFMVRFLIAIARDENRVAHPVRATKRSEVAGSPASYLAMGVVRITTALASNASPVVHRLEMKHRLESRT